MPKRRSRRPPSTDAEPPPRRDKLHGFDDGVHLEYDADPRGDVNAGEIVWTWVPFEDNPRAGKDRPVLVIGRSGRHLLALMLTSRGHEDTSKQHARWGRRWIDIGTGPWDPDGRTSAVRVDRIMRIDSRRVRREAAIIDLTAFDTVVAEVRRIHGRD